MKKVHLLEESYGFYRRQDLEFRGSAEATERSERGRLAAAAQTLAAGAVS